MTPPNAEYGMLFIEYSVIRIMFVMPAYATIMPVLQPIGVV